MAKKGRPYAGVVGGTHERWKTVFLTERQGVDSKRTRIILYITDLTRPVFVAACDPKP